MIGYIRKSVALFPYGSDRITNKDYNNNNNTTINFTNIPIVASEPGSSPMLNVKPLLPVKRRNINA